ncbi:MAG: hypothetical protein IJV29_18840 [Butyrivibrio sp.]|nr:hypothetical protein [Butyrivibrio sp.]MBQ7431670.1 hypothetical protein [Butyrivibrio sp.]
MTSQEFSNGFDTLVNSYRRFKDFDKQEVLDSIEFDEYEKSFYLTKAQEEIVINFYNGKNPYGDSFESTEEMRRYLESLVKTKVYSIEEQINGNGVSNNSIFYKLPKDIAFITMEQITYGDESLGCYNGSTATIYPITQDEYSRIKKNPFRGPTKYKAIRLDCGDNIVELISKYKIKDYLIRYLSKPEPIILEDLPNDLTIEGEDKRTECKLNSILHDTILDRAVQIALQAKGISVTK